MFKFRRETWGKKIDHERAWSTCYSDVIRGYGKFHGNNLIHLRRLPKICQPKTSKRLPGPLAPKVDHMWDALQGKGIAAYGSSRHRLRWLLGEQRRPKPSPTTSRTRAAEPGQRRTSDGQAKWNGRSLLPPLNSGEEEPGSGTSLLTPRHVLVSVPEEGFSTWARGAEGRYSYGRKTPANKVADNSRSTAYSRDPIKQVGCPPPDPDSSPRAGLPSIWKKKPAHHVRIPPPYHPQPPPIPFSHTRDSDLYPSSDETFRRSGERLTAQDGLPPEASASEPNALPPGVSASGRNAFAPEGRLLPAELWPLPSIRSRRCVHGRTSVMPDRLENGPSRHAPPEVELS